MEGFFALALGLLVLGIVASLSGGSALPLLVILAVIGAGSCCNRGIFDGGKRR